MSTLMTNQEISDLLNRFDQEIELFFRAARRGQTLLVEIRQEIARHQDIINQQTELIKKYEIDNRQLEHLLKSYKEMVEED